MIQLIESGKKDQAVIRAAGAIVRGVRQFDRAAEAAAVYNWVRGHIRFTSDVKGVETLRSPAETLAAGVGDCDDYVILICALLSAVGHTMRIITVASDQRDPSVFTHVYPEDRLGNGWVALDAARRSPAIGKRPSRIYRVRVWEMDGGFEDLDPREYLGGRTGNGSGGDSRALAMAHYPEFSGLGFLAQDDFSQIMQAITPAITAGTTGAANIIRASTPGYALPPGYAIGPGGVPVQSAAYAAPSSLGNYMPILLIGGLLLAVMAMKR